MNERLFQDSMLVIVAVVAVITILSANQAFALDDEWEYREQPFTSGSVLCSWATSASPTDRLVVSSGTTSFGFCHLFKVFDKSEIINKDLEVTWTGTVGSAGGMRIYVLDGSYDRTVGSDFLANNNAEGYTAVLKGGGLLHSINRTSTFGTTTDSFNMTMAGSTESQVTIAVDIRDSSQVASNFMDITQIEIVDLAKWIWDKSSSVTSEVAGTNDDRGRTNADLVFPLTVDQWQFREQLMISQGGSPMVCDIDGVLQNRTISGHVDMDISAGSLGFCNIFKSFPRSEVINKNLNVTWAGTFSGIALDHRITVFDGAYDRHTPSDFPANDGLGFLTTKGAYTLHSSDRTSATPFAMTKDVINMTLTGSIESDVTVRVGIRDGSASNALELDLFEISIDDVGKWQFDTSQTNYTSEVAGTTGFDTGFFTTIFTDIGDMTPPVLTLLGDNPIQHLKDTFYADAGATCLDDVDGQINGNVVIDSSAVDTSTVGSYQVTLDCDDSQMNTAIQLQRTVNVVEITIAGDGDGSGFATPSLTGKGGVGAGSALSKLEDVPPLVQPTPPPTEVERAISIFDRLNEFFQRPEVEEVTERVEDVAVDVGEGITTEVQERLPPQESFIDRIRNFFSGLFGFIYGFELIPEAFAVPTDNWDLKEQEIISPSGCTFTDTATTLDADTDVTGRSHCIVFKVFDKSDIINKILNVTWSGAGTGAGRNIDFSVLDGSYDRTNSTDFPTNTGLIGFSTVLKGAGVLHEVDSSGDFSTRTDSLNMTLPLSTESQITVTMKIRDNVNSAGLGFDINVIEIVDFAIWNFTDSFVNMTVTGGDFDHGFANSTFTDTSNKVPPVITLLGMNPQSGLLGSLYGEQGATCVDDIDGDISGNLIIDSTAVDINTVGSYPVTYDCADNSVNQNDAIQVIRTFNIVAVGDGGGGGGYALSNPSGSGGVDSRISKLSDVEPLFDPTTPPTEVDRAISIFDRLNSFFDRPEVEEVTERVEDVAVDVGERITTEVQERLPPQESFIDRIRNFFSGLFGFIYGFELIPEAFAQTVTRMDNYEITQHNQTSFTQKLGLPMYIQNATGDYVPYLYTENATGIEIESGIVTLYYDKSACKLSVYNAGEMNQTSSYIDDDQWLVRVAPNGTENWSDVPESFLSCNVTTDYLSDSVQINSTKTNVNATISEIYNYQISSGIKHDLYFTNNNPDWNDHKFSWSNIMSDIPNSFAIMRVLNHSNGDLTNDMYSVHSGVSQPFQLNGDANLLDYASSESVSYNSTDFIWNGTQVGHGFALYPQDSASIVDVVLYAFKDAIDQLSSVVFTSNPDQTLDVRVDYANVTQALGIGETMYLDPLLTTNQAGDRFWSGAFGNPCASGSSTASDLTGATGFAHVTASGSSESCSGTYFFYDISSIPDVAVPSRVTLSLNQTAGTCSGTLCSTSPMIIRLFEITSENLSGLSLVDFAKRVGRPFSGTDIDPTAVSSFNTPIGFTPPSQRVFSFTSPSGKVLIDFEAQLESGKNYWQWMICGQVASGFGCSFEAGTPSSRSNSVTWQRLTTSFFEVDYDVFTVPSAPQNQTATYSASPDKCFVDWEPPLDDGGRPVDGYRIDRSINGGAFSTLVADTGSPVPTDHTDTTIMTGESYVYRLFAINAEGTGAGADTASCGIPSISDPPIGLIVFEQPDNDITLDWETAPFDGGLPVLGYKIERMAGSGGFTIIEANTGTTDTTFIDSGVQANILFTYRVSQINSLGTSSPSNEASFTIVIPTGAGAIGAGEAPTPEPEPPVFPQEEFDQALAEAIAEIEARQLSVVEEIISPIFEFAVVDNTHEDLVLNSFLDNQRLGIRWSSGQDIIVLQITPSPSPFLFSFEQVPVIKRGSGAVISTDFILYNVQVPRLECTVEITQDCVAKARYEVPIQVTALIGNSTVTDTGSITIDLVDELIDPILVLLLATFGIPIFAGLVQRARGKSAVPPLRESLRGV